MNPYGGARLRPVVRTPAVMRRHVGAAGDRAGEQQQRGRKEFDQSCCDLSKRKLKSSREASLRALKTSRKHDRRCYTQWENGHETNPGALQPIATPRSCAGRDC